MAIRRVKHYRIKRKIGSGGMATVYEAIDEHTGITVALKILHSHLADQPTYVERFSREAQVAMNLHSPHIARVLDSGRDKVDGDPVYYIAMEYIPGVTLTQLMRNESISSVAQVMNIAYQVAQALAEANRHGIVHRDIKPQNIMITPDGTVKVMDFGIARESFADSLTMTGVFVGTPQYSSPEQALGEKDVDIRSDIYSLGVVLYHLLTGAVPFQADTPQALLNRVARGNPVPVESHRIDLPPEVSSIVNKMLQRDPTNRFQTPEELMEALEPLITPAAEEADAEMATIVAPMVSDNTESRATIPGDMRKKVPLPVIISSLLVLLLAVVAAAFSDGILPSSQRSTPKTTPVSQVSPAPSRPAVTKELPIISPTTVVAISAAGRAAVTPARTWTPLRTYTQTPQVLTATPTVVVRAVVLPKTLNVRSGPGTNYPLIGKVHQGNSFEVKGRNSDSTWIQVLLRKGILGWVYSQFVRMNGNPGKVAVVTVTAPASTATAFPTPTWTPVPPTFTPTPRPRRKPTPSPTAVPSRTATATSRPPSSTWTPEPVSPTWTPRPVVTATPPLPSLSGDVRSYASLSWKDLLLVLGFLTLLDAGSVYSRKGS